MEKLNKTAIKNFFDDSVDDRNKTELLIDNIVFLKGLDVKEYTLYKKYLELQTHREQYIKAVSIKDRIWRPTDFNNEELTIKEFTELRPKIFLVDNDSAYKDAWLLLRVFGHTMEFSANPGRFLKFLVIDEITNKYLGVVSVGSDVTAIAVRDKYIGWTRDDKFKKHKLNHSAIGTCIMALQPFGYNFLGGKLIASLLTTDVIRNIWEEKYGETLVGMSTTSLYGSASMYNNIPWWRKMGSSQGKIIIKPDDDIYKEWLDWLREEHRDVYTKLTRTESGRVATSPKQNVLKYIFKQTHANFKEQNLAHGFQRGVYYSLFYENGCEFFRDEIKEDELKLKEKFTNNYDKIIEWWKPKAINRYKKLQEENRLKPEIHFYDDIIGKTWEDTEEKYLKEVGR